MRIIFSRDRAAQLDLLLRSIAKNMEHDETHILAYASTDDFRCGYEALGLHAPETDFDTDLRATIGVAGETITFFCDDDVVYGHVPIDPQEILLSYPGMLTFSLRLGIGNTQMERPARFPIWEWWPLERHDFGFPASIDGHTFRTEDVVKMIGDEMIPNPTMLETVMAMRVEQMTHRPLMASFWRQKLVGVPVNRVSPSSGVIHGEIYPQTTEELNEKFLAGYQISLDRTDFSNITACHQEVQYVWEKRR